MSSFSVQCRVSLTYSPSSVSLQHSYLMPTNALQYSSAPEMMPHCLIDSLSFSSSSALFFLLTFFSLYCSLSILCFSFLFSLFHSSTLFFLTFLENFSVVSYYGIGFSSQHSEAERPAWSAGSSRTAGKLSHKIKINHNLKK